MSVHVSITKVTVKEKQILRFTFFYKIGDFFKKKYIKVRYQMNNSNGEPSGDPREMKVARKRLQPFLDKHSDSMMDALKDYLTDQYNWRNLTVLSYKEID